MSNIMEKLSTKKVCNNIHTYLLWHQISMKLLVLLHSCYLCTNSIKLYTRECDTYNMQYNGDDEPGMYEDLVQKQYQKLPYPVFTQDQLKEEQKSYDTKPNWLPRLISNNNDFEVLNHFLFYGTQNFT